MNKLPDGREIILNISENHVTVLKPINEMTRDDWVLYHWEYAGRLSSDWYIPIYNRLAMKNPHEAFIANQEFDVWVRAAHIDKYFTGSNGS